MNDSLRSGRNLVGKEIDFAARDLPGDSIRLESGEVHLWLTSTLMDENRLKLIESFLLDEEIARANRFHFDRDRRQFVIARGLLRMFLESYSGVSYKRQTVFQKGQHGKPYAANSEVMFNVAHTGNYVLIGFSRGVDLGVDIEMMEPQRDFLAIAERYFSTAEQSALRELEDSDVATGFYNAWTRKEAFLKAVGVGLSDHLHGFDVSLSPYEEARIVSIRPIDPAWKGETASQWSLFALDAAPDVAGALAQKGAIDRKNISAWRINHL